MFAQNCWYVAGWLTEFEEGKPHARVIAGERVALFRTSKGLVALEDRCVHRMAPLSLGRCEGDTLRCMYHGLRFAADGSCIEIPGQGRIPDAARVKSYAIVERHSWAWIWIGDRQADASLIPNAIGLDHPDWAIKCGGHLDYDANYALINDNLLDFSHLSYVHANSFGAGPEWAESRPTVTMLDRGVRVSRWMPKSSASERMRQARGVTGEPTDSFSSYDFMIPGILLLGSATYPAGTAERYPDSRPDMEPITATFSCQAVTPMTEKTSRYFFSWGPRAGPGAEEVASRLLTIADQAFAEDKVMIEAQQRVISDTQTPTVMPTTADKAVILFQRLMARHMKDRSDSAVAAA